MLISTNKQLYNDLGSSNFFIMYFWKSLMHLFDQKYSKTVIYQMLLQFKIKYFLILSKLETVFA